MDKLHQLLSMYSKLEDQLTLDFGSINRQYIYPKPSREWGGAGVIVTDNSARNCHDGDLLLVTEHARPINWMMFKLRDLSNEFIHELGTDVPMYVQVAHAARAYLDEHTHVNDQALMLACLAAAQDIVQITIQRQSREM